VRNVAVFQSRSSITKAENMGMYSHYLLHGNLTSWRRNSLVFSSLVHIDILFSIFKDPRIFFFWEKTGTGPGPLSLSLALRYVATCNSVSFTWCHELFKFFFCLFRYLENDLWYIQHVTVCLQDVVDHALRCPEIYVEKEVVTKCSSSKDEII